ncbi:MAG: T9SS type A sorting domain-containing protein [Caldithrix sp.]|nr:T9SS type A sorting domain-containing protein [Caldithrix sp.]
MKGRFTLVVMLIFGLTLSLMAKEINFAKPVENVKVSSEAKLIQAQKEITPYAVNLGHTPLEAEQAVNKPAKTTASFHKYITMQPNGYGWLNPAIRSIDRYNGIDNPNYGGSGSEIDFLLLSYREDLGDDETGWIGATELDVAGGLDGSATYSFERLNNGLGGVGGRYPGAVALDKPLVAFNQYVSGDVQTTPAISHPYLMTDFVTWGTNGGGWTTPSYQMDVGWLHPEVQANTTGDDQQNRLWNGPVSVVKDADGTYHWMAIYETWFSDVEKEDPPIGFGAENDNHIFTATTSDPSIGWTFGWDVGNDPVHVDPNVVTIPRPAVALNDAGFGAIVSPGHLGWHHPDSGYYFSELKITYSTTEDYGVSWSAWDTVSFGDMGFPTYHNAEDSLLGQWQVIGEDTVWVPYEGPTFLGTNFDMDVIVDGSNNIMVGFNMLWGQPSDDGWYPSPYYSGVFMAKKPYGDAWWASRIAYNNGVLEGDEQVEGRSQYFFDTEIDLSKDDGGNFYAAWLDRRNNDVEIANMPRYSTPQEGGSPTYKTDIYASHTIDGGMEWTEPINISNTIQDDEYELNMALHSKNTDVRGNYGVVWVCYSLCADTLNPLNDEAYITRQNEAWVAEGSEFNTPSALTDQDAQIARGYSLEQNYPNPFNPTTRINFVPQTSGQANLSVYNVSGQKVAELFDGYARKGNQYSYEFNGINLASGIYFYRLTIAGSVEVKKMALVK